MSCKVQESQIDLKALVLDEMDPAARRAAEAHLAACNHCQDELTALRATLDALAVLREEEVPRRIAFVSDKIFEPHFWQPHFWQKTGWRRMFLRPSFPGPAFMGALLLAGAILVHALVRPLAPPPREPVKQIDTASFEKTIEKRVTERLRAEMADSVQTAVAKAVAETRQQDDRRTTALLAAAERRYAETAGILSRQVTRIYAMNSGAGVR